MARIKINLPEKFIFSTSIPVRITDLNYGNHVGNDSILSILHEARVQYLNKAGLAELAFEGVGLIMTDVGIEFKAEAFYGDVLKAYVKAEAFSKIGFDLYYKLVRGQAEEVVAAAKTGMLCFDYEKRKIVSLPEKAKMRLAEL